LQENRMDTVRKLGRKILLKRALSLIGLVWGLLF